MILALLLALQAPAIPPLADAIVHAAPWSAPYDLPPIPGALNPAVTQDTIQQTICKSGWTKTIRPPVSYTNKLKAQLMAKYHLPGKLSDWELDHLVPLEIGGNPTSPDNLWMEHWANPHGARVKDALETSLKRRVCAGTIPLAEAQASVRTDWLAAYRKYLGKDPQ